MQRPSSPRGSSEEPGAGRGATPAPTAPRRGAGRTAHIDRASHVRTTCNDKALHDTCHGAASARKNRGRVKIVTTSRCNCAICNGAFLRPSGRGSCEALPVYHVGSASWVGCSDDDRRRGMLLQLRGGGRRRRDGWSERRWRRRRGGGGGGGGAGTPAAARAATTGGDRRRAPGAQHGWRGSVTPRYGVRRHGRRGHAHEAAGRHRVRHRQLAQHGERDHQRTEQHQ